MSLEDRGRGTRRRGAALEDALLTAAWDELLEKGYEAFTIESVADRARTGRAVIYRRWATKPDLVRAALAHNGFRDRVTVPDTGTLRGDLVELLRDANRVRVRFATVITAQLAALHADSGTSPDDLRRDALADRSSALDELFARAVARGEADPDKLTPRTREVAVDLYRNEVFLTQQPVPDEVIESIVDEVALPLVRPLPRLRPMERGDRTHRGPR